MIKSSGLHAARGQIAWLLALAISTTIVIRLEQLELGSRLSALTTNPQADTGLAADITVQQARLRAPDAATAPVPDQIHLITALVFAGTQNSGDIPALRAEAAQIIAEIESTAPTDPVLLDAIRLCQAVLGI